MARFSSGIQEPRLYFPIGKKIGAMMLLILPGHDFRPEYVQHTQTPSTYFVVPRMRIRSAVHSAVVGVPCLKVRLRPALCIADGCGSRSGDQGRYLSRCPIRLSFFPVAQLSDQRWGPSPNATSISYPNPLDLPVMQYAPWPRHLDRHSDPDRPCLYAHVERKCILPPAPHIRVSLR